MDNNFLSRWSKRKLTAQSDPELLPNDDAFRHDDVEQAAVEQAHIRSLVDDDSSRTVDADAGAETEIDNNELAPSNEHDIDHRSSEYQPSVASLLTSQVDKAVKQAALRKLFLSEEFNVVDGLNDYDYDYASVKSLSSDVASQLRGWVNKQEEPDTDDVQSNDLSEESTSHGIADEEASTSHRETLSSKEDGDELCSDPSKNAEEEHSINEPCQEISHKPNHIGTKASCGDSEA